MSYPTKHLFFFHSLSSYSAGPQPFVIKYLINQWSWLAFLTLTWGVTLTCNVCSTQSCLLHTLYSLYSGLVLIQSNEFWKSQSSDGQIHCSQLCILRGRPHLLNDSWMSVNSNEVMIGITLMSHGCFKKWLIWCLHYILFLLLLLFLAQHAYSRSCLSMYRIKNIMV